MRWPILLLIPLVLAAMIFWQRDIDGEPEDAQVTSSPLSWFCPVISQSGILQLTNPLPDQTIARITIYSSLFEGGANSEEFVNSEESVPYMTSSHEISVPLQSTEAINLRELFQQAVQTQRPEDAARVSELFSNSAVFLSVLAEFSEQGPIADLRVCTNSTSSEWFIPFASTARDACYFLAIFNPFSAPAVLDVEFSSDEGKRFPYEGKVIPARSSLVLNVGSKVTRRNHISTNLSARNGKVVVSKYLTFTGASDSLARTCPQAPYSFSEENPDKLWGSQILVGAPEAETSWYFPTGLSGSHSGSYIIYNPDRENSIEVQMRLFPNTGPELSQILIVLPSQRLAVQQKTDSAHPLPEFPEPVSAPAFRGSDTGHWALFESEKEFIAEKLETLVQVEDGVSGSLGDTQPKDEIRVYKNLLNFSAESQTAFYAIVNPSAETIARLFISSLDLNIEIAPRRRFILSLNPEMLLMDETIFSTVPVLGEPFP